MQALTVIGLILFSASASAGYVGLQNLFLKRISELSERPMASLAIVLSAFVMSSLVGCFTVDRTPFRHPSRWLRILTVLLFMTATASHMLLSALSHLRLPDIAHLILGASLIAPAAIVSGFVFGTFFQAVDESHTRQMPWVLAAGAGGVGLACYQIQRLDFTVLIGLCVLLFALAPADKREPESSPTE